MSVEVSKWPLLELEKVKTVAALKGGFAATGIEHGVLNLDAFMHASKFCELSCMAVWPLTVLPAALATTMLVVPPPETIVVASYLLTGLAEGEDGTQVGILPTAMVTTQPS